jgi:hypothetical protein
VSWSVEVGGVTVWSPDGVRRSIPYPSAALWALLANGNYNETFAAELLGVLEAAGPEEALGEVEQTLAGWMRAGLVAED